MLFFKSQTTLLVFLAVFTIVLSLFAQASPIGEDELDQSANIAHSLTKREEKAEEEKKKEAPATPRVQKVGVEEKAGELQGKAESAAKKKTDEAKDVAKGKANDAAKETGELASSTKGSLKGVADSILGRK